MTIMQTHSGPSVNLLKPTIADINHRDIAVSAAKACRFNGHTLPFYSVAQHAVLVSELLPFELQAKGLLHDSHEPFIGDIITPMKDALEIELPGFKDALGRITDRWDKVIHESLGLSWPLTEKEQAMIRHADLVMLATEKRDLMVDSPDWPDLPPPRNKRIKPLPWECAADLYMSKFDLLIGKHHYQDVG